MPPRRKFDRQERSSGPRYHCFLCQRSIDSPIQACPKHEPELHRKLTDLSKKRDSRPPEGRESDRKSKGKAPADKPRAKAPADKPKEEAKKPEEKKKEAAAPEPEKK